MRKLTRDEVVFDLDVFFEDEFTPSECLATGCDEVDAKLFAEIEKGIESGNVWAWCRVEVSAEWCGLRSVEHLGGCSYESREDFKDGGYFEQMEEDALSALQRKAENIARALESEPTSSAESAPVSWPAKTAKALAVSLVLAFSFGCASLPAPADCYCAQECEALR